MRTPYPLSSKSWHAPSRRRSQPIYAGHTPSRRRSQPICRVKAASCRACPFSFCSWRRVVSLSLFHRSWIMLSLGECHACPLSFCSWRRVVSLSLSHHSRPLRIMRSLGEYSIPSTIATELQINPFMRVAHEDVKAFCDNKQCVRGSCRCTHRKSRCSTSSMFTHVIGIKLPMFI